MMVTLVHVATDSLDVCLGAEREKKSTWLRLFVKKQEIGGVDCCKIIIKSRIFDNIISFFKTKLVLNMSEN